MDIFSSTTCIEPNGIELFSLMWYFSGLFLMYFVVVNEESMKEYFISLKSEIIIESDWILFKPCINIGIFLPISIINVSFEWDS